MGEFVPEAFGKTAQHGEFESLIAGADDLLRLLSADRIGRSVEVSVLREGRLITRSVTAQERPPIVAARR